MKPICKVAVLVAMLISFQNSQGQVVTERRPELFAAFAKTINFPKSQLEKIFFAAEGKSIKLSLGDNVGLSGVVSSSIQRYANLHSVIIKLNNLDNAVLGISRRVNDDNTISYVGRMINTKYADAFVLKADANGNYSINKIKTESLLEDHD